ncbi:hypothetical protein IPJ72_02910 [Candidatus Peregrinibacteria bacterium]|nr:MAG: hypothetical protein IPJ72_02910 [Candidatus Peregrinibacteria bacterium]
MFKHFFYFLLGSVLLSPWKAFAVTIDDFRDSVFPPDNLPLGSNNSAPVEARIVEIILFATNLVLYASGSVAVILLIIGGIRYITSLGNQERMDGAKKTIQYALIGLFVVILSYAIVNNVIDLIFKLSV